MQLFVLGVLASFNLHLFATGTGWANVNFLLESVRLGIATGSGVRLIHIIC